MKEIYKELEVNYEINYANFSQKLVPNIEQNLMCGIRIPKAKNIAKKYVNTEQGKEFLNTLNLVNLDEKNVYGLMLGYIKNEQEMHDYLVKFLPQIDNWLTCDITVSNLKIIKKYPQKYKKMAFYWLNNENFYIKRFAVVVLLNYFLDNNFEQSDLYTLAKIDTNDYYFNMSLAWYFSVAMVKQYNATINILKTHQIVNKFVHNKTIQKCCESYRVNKDIKQQLKMLKIV